VSLDKTVVNEVYRVILEKPGNPGQFPYIDCWQNAMLSQPIWLRPCLEKACRVMVASVVTTSKCRETIKELILDEEPKEMPPPYVPLYPPLLPAHNFTPLPPTSDVEAQGTVTPLKSGPEASGASTLLGSLSPMVSLQVCWCSPHILHSIGGLQPIFTRTPFLLRLPLLCRCP
jgi:hypothetical protein